MKLILELNSTQGSHFYLSVTILHTRLITYRNLWYILNVAKLYECKNSTKVTLTYFPLFTKCKCLQNPLLNFNNSCIQNIIECICITNQTPFNEWWERKISPSKPQRKPRKTIQIRNIIIEFIVELAAASLLVLVLLNFQKVCFYYSAFWLHFLPCMHLFESYRNGIQINCNA